MLLFNPAEVNLAKKWESLKELEGAWPGAVPPPQTNDAICG